ncbi:GTR5 protein, partial [Psilopogon haemacephalus]|nr:GTR5 protein [Psilopogon haemacephalus]
PSEDMITLMWSFVVSIYSIGGLLGSLSAGYLSVRFGRKKAMLFANIPALLSAALMGLSRLCGSFEMLIAGRLFSGVCGGKLAFLSVYAGEISPKKLRGFVNVTSSVFLALGKAVARVLGLRELLGSQTLWPMLMASSGLPALVQIVTLPFFPESPPYLLMHKGDQEACKKAIRQLWGEGHHQADIDDIMKEKATMKNTKILSVLELMREPATRWQLYMIVILTATIQLCGINAV